METLDDPHAPALSQSLVQALAQRIIDGRLPSGERVRQEQVAAEFQVSQAVVREAFRALEARGLLVSLPRRGVRVPRLDRPSVRELTVMRAALEPAALREALAHPERDWLADAQAAIAEADRTRDIVAWEAANQRFHRALTRGCRMPRLVRQIDDLHLASARYLHACWARLGWQTRSQADHLSLVQLIMNGQNEAACDALRRHINDAGAALEQVIEPGPPRAD